VQTWLGNSAISNLQLHPISDRFNDHFICSFLDDSAPPGVGVPATVAAAGKSTMGLRIHLDTKQRRRGEERRAKAKTSCSTAATCATAAGRPAAASCWKVFAGRPAAAGSSFAGGRALRRSSLDDRPFCRVPSRRGHRRLAACQQWGRKNAVDLRPPTAARSGPGDRPHPTAATAATAAASAAGRLCQPSGRLRCGGRLLFGLLCGGRLLFGLRCGGRLLF
jgi:hypothetical protein